MKGYVDIGDKKAAPARDADRPPPKPKEYKRPARVPPAVAWDATMQKALAMRGISEDVRLQFGLINSHCTLGKDADGQWIKVPALAFPYRDRGELVLIKYRLHGEKTFRQSPQPAPSIYNIDGLRAHLATNPAIKTAVICEGEFDCMALATCGVTNAITTNLGASQANNPVCTHLFATSEDIAECEDILLAGDEDAVGKGLMNDIADAVGRHRCKMVDWTHHCTHECVRTTGEKDKNGELKLDADGNPLTRVCKDAGDVLVNHGRDRLINCLDRAEPIGDQHE
ncbi:MAG: toprim domain-containing protein [Gammaproteobacteria bacterium]|nr:toprim domain-containing protein [Gammaproteobacteria bacterium]